MKDKYLYLIFGLLMIGSVVLIVDSIQVCKVEVEEVRNVLPKNEDKELIGEASWYDYEFPKGSGNWVTKNKLVVASRDYPRGTKLRVCSDRCVEVKVTDFGPEERTGRIIDLGSKAFSMIGNLRDGVINVNIVKIK